MQPLDAFMLHRATSDYGNITTLSESPLRAGVLAVGTDDGLVQVTRDDGGTWQIGRHLRSRARADLRQPGTLVAS